MLKEHVVGQMDVGLGQIIINLKECECIKAENEKKVEDAKKVENEKKAEDAKKVENEKKEEKPMTIQDYLKQAPAPFKEILTNSYQQHEAYRVELLDTLLKNKSN